MPGLPRAVLIDDDAENLTTMSHILAGHFESICATDGIEGLRLAEEHRPDIIVLDVKMPRVDGFGIFAQIKEFPQIREIPVVMVTAYPATEDRIRSYELGVNDYIQQPCGARELIARLKARTRQQYGLRMNDSKVQRIGNLTFNEETKEVTIENKPVFFSPREFELLRFFLNRPEKVVTRKDLLSMIWMGVRVSPRNPDSQITNLRKKLVGFNYSIFAMKGQGYILRRRK